MAIASNQAKPIGLLIAAMGGEGGGVLRQWLVDAAMAHGFAVQSTSIPGVAQRTGATTYYIEMQALDEHGQRPVMSLYPLAGSVDIMVASELIEAGRAMQNGFVTPNCTTLIASTHRVYAVAERTAMGDGRFDGSRVVEAAGSLAQQAVLFDMEAMAQRHDSVINAVLLGAIAGSHRLPIPFEGFEAAVRDTGRAVEANLAAFRAGYEAVEQGGLTALVPDSDLKRPWRADPPMVEELQHRVREEFPAPARTILREGVNRLVDYQNLAYAERYLQRLMPIERAELEADGHGELVREAGRYLALWMSYEDVIRVAQAKLRPERQARIRRDVGAKPNEPVRIREYLKPGLDEVTALMPGWIARPLLAAAESAGWRDRLNIGMTINSTALWGHFLLRFLASMRALRPFGHRYKSEQVLIDEWLENITKAAALDLTLATEIAACQRLLKGYGQTHRHGWESFNAIMETLVTPALKSGADPKGAALTIALARDAALADPTGDTLQDALSDDAKSHMAAE
ncbi:MAG: indolepyruvate oxidoreductase subunit beta family protein [Rhodospirillaceae bacterium]|nr:indolepyruvate oxidoreductase subunit beta family protein [Rhodospirillaceae bacterium]MBT5195251.1 indolepyruvate oxidoreductase subunit beta family protein [Rhodospirillaceae bacterium]MBT5897035.1 indolepyruvate oxidoreductase subunit beta family protein [Rhodospirillaceae bacterium]MBT6427633.1 indolepyruvate oxidoreductase subunit beta family protein [Rhodospirillaceae bacterium]MBT7759254.1 indolepyruvate oxidoreductase subunit beta family protein [Rhodospirillaceae bacterium]